MAVLYLVLIWAILYRKMLLAFKEHEVSLVLKTKQSKPTKTTVENINFHNYFRKIFVVPYEIHMKGIFQIPKENRRRSLSFTLSMLACKHVVILHPTKSH